MSYSPKSNGLLQATGLVCYVGAFATIVQYLGKWAGAQDMEPSPAISITLFLLTFIISALISASIVFAHPLFLFLAGKKEEAVKTVLWTLVFLVIFLLLFLTISLPLSRTL
ncbi:MAG: hypothetical protein Q7R64_03470 [bacterium]|nr:hypothetical protein [bacterium]